jgi:hypothetical protein
MMKPEYPTRPFSQLIVLDFHNAETLSLPLNYEKTFDDDARYG